LENFWERWKTKIEVQGSRFRVQGSGLKDKACQVLGSGFRVERYTVPGSRFTVPRLKDAD
jgi:hypothetical protein